MTPERGTAMTAEKFHQRLQDSADAARSDIRCGLLFRNCLSGLWGCLKQIVFRKERP